MSEKVHPLKWVEERSQQVVARRQAEEREAAAKKQQEREAKLKADLESFQLPLALRIPRLNDPNSYPLPNSLARSSLFAATKDSERPMLRGVQVFSLGNYSIWFTGDQLNQSDLDVFMALLCEASNEPFGTRIYFSAYALLKRMNWSMNTTGYKRLTESLYRMQRSQVVVRYDRGGENKRAVDYAGSLIANFGHADDRPLAGGSSEFNKSRWSVLLDTRLSELFVNEDTTIGLWSVRRKIDGRQPLAQHLLNYFQTHAEPIPSTCEFFKNLTGTKEQNDTNFVYRLSKALDKLVDIGFLKDWRFLKEDCAKPQIKRRVFVERVSPKILGERARYELQRQRRGSSQLNVA